MRTKTISIDCCRRGRMWAMALPVIGWILAIVFALNDDNLNRRNFARGYWCMVLVVVILSIVGMVMGVSIMDGLSSYQYNYRY